VTKLFAPSDVMAGLVPQLSGSARPVVKFKSLTTLARLARACPGQDAERFHPAYDFTREGTFSMNRTAVAQGRA
jgi:hypothetical protein